LLQNTGIFEGHYRLGRGQPPFPARLIAGLFIFRVLLCRLTELLRALIATLAEIDP